jgi:hypothetical protein
MVFVHQPSACEETRDYRDRYEKITGSSLIECPACHRGRMVVIDVLSPTQRSPPIRNTS